jgi:hypothetical protein
MSALYPGSASSTTSGLITLAGDLGNTASVPYVESISGASPIAITPSVLQFNSTTTAPTIKQAAAASGAGQNLTLAPQSATTTGASGSLVVNVAAPASGTAEAGIILERAGSTLLTMCGDPSHATTNVNFHGIGVTPSSTNYFMSIGASNFYLSSTGNSSSAFQFQYNGSTYIQLGFSGAQALNFTSGLTVPGMSQAAPITDTTVYSTTIAAQPAYASASVNTTGGALILSAGANATSVGGYGQIQFTTSNATVNMLDGYTTQNLFNVLQTSSNSATTITTIPIASNTSQFITASILGLDELHDGYACAATVSCVAIRQSNFSSGTLTLVPAVPTPNYITNLSGSSMSVSVSVSSNNIIIQCTGLSGIICNWQAVVQTQELA